MAKIDGGRKLALRITALKDALPCVPAVENSRGTENSRYCGNSLSSVQWQGAWERLVVHLLIERIAARKHCFVVVVHMIRLWGNCVVQSALPLLTIVVTVQQTGVAQSSYS